MRWLREWYRLYYIDNPVAWLLVKVETEQRLTKIGAPSPTEAGTPEQRYRYIVSDSENPRSGARFLLWADDTQFAQAVKAPWYAPRSPAISLYEQLYLSVATLLVMTVLLIYYTLQFSRPSMDVGVTGSVTVCLALFLPMLSAMRATSAFPLLFSLESDLFVGFTRLRGRCLVRGAVAFALPRMARASAIYGLPVLFLLGSLAHGTPWTGLAVALTLWVYGVAVAPLWVALNLLMSYGVATRRLPSGAMWVQGQNYALLGVMTLAVVVLAQATGQSHEAVRFWSLTPPMFIVSMLKVAYHPLWSFVPLLFAALVGWGALRVMEAVMSSVFRTRERPMNAEVEGWE